MTDCLQLFLLALVFWAVALLAYASGKHAGRRQERADITQKGWNHNDI